MKSVFEEKDHYSYLSAQLDPRRAARGTKLRLAKHPRVQPAFISQVLKRKHPLSLELAESANTFLGHSLEESEYFLLMVSHDRAGTVALRQVYKRSMDDFLRRRQEVIGRLGRKGEISSAAQGVYYSSWLYSAIHVATTIPHLRKLKPLLDFFGIPLGRMREILQFLQENRLIEKSGEDFLATKNWIRLARTSPLINKLHSNWREVAVANLAYQTEEDLNFSGIYSLDEASAREIREALLECIKKQVKVIEQAPEKKLYVLGVDFFSLKGRKNDQT